MTKFYLLLIIILIGLLRGFASVNSVENTAETTAEFASEMQTSNLQIQNMTETMENKNADQTTKMTFSATMPPSSEVNDHATSVEEEKKRPDEKEEPEFRTGSTLNQDGNFRRGDNDQAKERVFDNMNNIEKEYKMNEASFNSNKSDENRITAQQVRNNINGEMERIEAKMDDEFIGEESYALHYFAIFILLFALIYLGYHSRKRIIGYLVEGRNNNTRGVRYCRLSQSVNAANI